MSNTAVENFFDDVATGTSAPSAVLKVVNDGVIGEIVDQYIVDAKKFGSEDIETDRDGKPIKQLVVILQTDLRNWDRVVRVPRVDPKDPNSPDKAATEDDGKRAIYVKQYTNLQSAVSKAVEEGAGKRGPLLNGGTLGVKVVELRNTGKGNPLKIFVAKYTAPAASSGDFFGGSQETAAPAQQTSSNTQDPWSGQSVPNPGTSERTEEPPF